MSHTCEFCNNKFTNHLILKTHKNSAKYCLKIQKELEDTLIISEFICEHCNKKFTLKQGLSRHIKSCKELKIKTDSNTLTTEQECITLKNSVTKLEKHIENLEKNECEIINIKHEYIILKTTIIQLEKQLEKKDEHIRELQDKMERITTTAISRPTTVQNNTNTNNINTKYSYLSPLTITSEEIKNRVNTHFTHEHFKKGQVGVADFAYRYIIPDEDGNPTYIFADIARKKCVFKDSDGNVIPDVKCQKLISMLIDPINARSKYIYDQMYASVEGEGSDDEVLGKRIAFLNLLKEIARLPRDSVKFSERILEKSNMPIPPLIETQPTRGLFHMQRLTNRVFEDVDDGDDRVFTVMSDSEDEHPTRSISQDELPFIDFDDTNIDRLVGIRLDSLKIVYKDRSTKIVKMEPCIYFYKDDRSKLRPLFYQYQGEDKNIYIQYTLEGMDFKVFPDPGITITENVYAIRYLEDKKRARVRYRDGREEIRNITN
jgi:hypothetical protein